MAPNRRKGASKAAAAAAARRQWKVGDLVLAKVKGFPAWPAVVSKPEKWGYSADWKKVLVFFFGTQQIAFCNPTDVEAFTEEKKQSLMVKRQGKGADFVRAIQEIVDSYEKLKEQNKNDEVLEQNKVNDGTVMDKFANLGSKLESEGPEEYKDLHLKSPHSSKDEDEPSLPAEFASINAQSNAFPDNKDSLDERIVTAVVTERPLPAIYTSGKRSGGSRSNIPVVQRHMPAVRRSRSSSRVESRKLQNAMTPVNDGGKNDGELLANIVPDGSLRWNMRSRKSPDGSDFDDVNSDPLTSNGSIEDNGSEIITVDSDTFSLNEGSTMESDCKLENFETANECLEGDIEFSKGLDSHIKAVVLRKKRKANRKRVTGSAGDSNVTPDKEDGLGAVVDNNSQNSQNTCEKKTESCSKEDGDEHLPLVKRARVRMGKPSFAEEELKTYSETEERIVKKATVNVSGQTCKDSSPGNDSVVDRGLPMENGPLDKLSHVSVSTQLSGDVPQLSKPNTEHQFLSSVDCEAALPPSKRLHRALEAMSANATEEDQADIETSIAKKTSTIGCSSFSMRISPALTMENEAGNGLGLQSINPHGNNFSQSDAPELSTSLNFTVLEESAKANLEVDVCNQSDESFNTRSLGLQNDVLMEDDMDRVVLKDNCGSYSGSHSDRTIVEIQSGNYLFSNSGCDRGTMDKMLPINDERHGNTVLSSNSKSENHTSENTVINSENVSGGNEIAKFSPESGNNVQESCMEDAVLEGMKSLKPALEEKSEENNMFKVEEANHKQSGKDQSSICFSNDQLGEKDGSGVRSSSSITDGGESLVAASPPHNSVCQVSTSDSSNFLQNNSSCSPVVNLPNKRSFAPPTEDLKSNSAVTQKEKYGGKDAEAHAALTSFETMLGTLTRTKESIGRATRVAIDCAKIGLGLKVVEVLTRIMDMESSFHKKLDLFLLVDSITQCSRNLKGNVAGIYPPAIQSVLPRILTAVAPSGNAAHENRRQCIKVLKLWSQRGVLPDSIVRNHMRELDSLNGSSSVGAYTRRSSRNERSLDDPLREMEGMFVDEYGSNSSFQLPGFCMPRMLKDEEEEGDEGSDSDGGSFEAVTPEHNSHAFEEHERVPIMEKHRHILEDVDGELEMEDVAPPCEVKMSTYCSSAVVNTAEHMHKQLEHNFPLHNGPPLPLPQVLPPSSPPLPSSPPPPPPPLPPPFARNEPYGSGIESKLYTQTDKMHDNSIQLASEQSNGPVYDLRIINDSVHYPASECNDYQMQIPDSSGRSFSGYSAQPVNNVQEGEPMTLHSKVYPLRPPDSAPSNHFSYGYADQSMKSRREAPSSPYSSRYHYVDNMDFVENMDRENYYNNHERMRSGPYESREGWRSPRPSYYGPRYSDRGRSSFGPGPYSGPPCEPRRFSNHGWRYPSRGFHNRNHMSYRPPFDGPIPVSNRGPGYWRPM